MGRGSVHSNPGTVIINDRLLVYCFIYTFQTGDVQQISVQCLLVTRNFTTFPVVATCRSSLRRPTRDIFANGVAATRTYALPGMPSYLNPHTDE